MFFWQRTSAPVKLSITNFRKAGRRYVTIPANRGTVFVYPLRAQRNTTEANHERRAREITRPCNRKKTFISAIRIAEAGPGLGRRRESTPSREQQSNKVLDKYLLEGGFRTAGSLHAVRLKSPISLDGGQIHDFFVDLKNVRLGDAFLSVFFHSMTSTTFIDDKGHCTLTGGDRFSLQLPHLPLWHCSAALRRTKEKGSAPEF